LQRNLIVQDRITAGATIVLLSYTKDKPRMIEQTPFQNKNLVKKLEAGENSTFLGLLQDDNKAAAPSVSEGDLSRI